MHSDSEVRSLVFEIVKTGNELREILDAADEFAVCGPPGHSAAISELGSRFRGRVPDEYLGLLSDFDGIKNFEWLDVDLLSVKYLLAHSDLDKNWIEAGACKAGEWFIFAQSSSDAHSVAFRLPKAGLGNELEVVNVDSGGILSEHADFKSYLRDRLEWFRLSLSEQQADRSQLKDD